MNYPRKQPDISMGIASVSPICGCRTGCAYCYIDLLGLSVPRENGFGIDKTVEALYHRPEFHSGKQGTAIVLGGWGELFPNDDMLRKHSINWIARLAKEKNPLVISTKGVLSRKDVDQIQSTLCEPNQLLVLETVTTLNSWKSVEPGAASPMQRLTSLQMCSNAGIKCGLLINPFLRGITESSFSKILEYSTKIETLEGVVVSPLFLNKLLLNKMKKNCLHELADSEWSQCNLTQSGSKISICAHSLQTEWPNLQQIANETRTTLLRHYLCLISRCFKRKCFLYGNLNYCIKCGNCTNHIFVSGK